MMSLHDRDTASLVADSMPSKRMLIIIALIIVIHSIVAISPLAQFDSDPDGYIGLAQQLADGKGFTNPYHQQPTAYRPPLYPIAISIGLRIGLTTSVSVAVINILAIVLMAVSVTQLGQWVGLHKQWLAASVFIAVFDPLILRYAAIPMTEVFSGSLLTCALLLLYSVLGTETNPTFHLNRTSRAFFAGLLFGLCFLCRPVAAVTCLFGLCFGLMTRYRASDENPNSGSRMPFRLALIIVSAAGMTAAPWVIRNYVQFHEFIPATTHGGYTLLLGNNSVFYREVVNRPDHPAWSGESLSQWQVKLHNESQAAGIPEGDEKAADRWMYARAKTEISDDPGSFLNACMLRWKRFWGIIPLDPSGQLPQSLKWATGCWYSLLWIGLIASILSPSSRRLPGVQLLWISILSFLAIHTFYWTNTRMRAPLAGVISILSITGWRAILNYLRQAVMPKPMNGTVE